MVQPKGLDDFLEDDSSLTEKITYEQFKKMQECELSDEALADAYAAYQKAISSDN